MPCNARVVQSAKLSQETLDRIHKLAKEKGWPVKPAPGGWNITVYPLTISVSGNTITFKSDADWDTGVHQIRNLVTMLKASGIEFTDAGQPETHRHDNPAGPWQRVGHS